MPTQIKRIDAACQPPTHLSGRKDSFDLGKASSNQVANDQKSEGKNNHKEYQNK